MSELNVVPTGQVDIATIALNTQGLSFTLAGAAAVHGMTRLTNSFDKLSVEMDPVQAMALRKAMAGTPNENTAQDGRTP